MLFYLLVWFQDIIMISFVCMLSQNEQFMLLIIYWFPNVYTTLISLRSRICINISPKSQILIRKIIVWSKSVIVESISTLKLHYLDSFFARDGRNFFSFRSARGSARAPKISSDLNSVRKIDDFCTKNEFKIFKTCF